MIVTIRRKRLASGFSLIEILIAVVILATGLLALTALQGRLAQASAEAKTRSRVASMLATRMEELRAGQYSNTVLDVNTTTGATTTTFACTSGAPAWLCTAQTESGVAGLGVTQVVSRYSSAIGASAFGVSGAAAANLSIPEFKRIQLTATWNDAAGNGHRLSISSDVSPLSLSSSTIPNASGGGGGGGTPIVRQDSPVTDGVIPLTVGNDATAASNPRPEVLELNGNNRKIVGTRFNVLTYQGDSGAVRIQRRVETSVIKCSCKYGRGGNQLDEIYREAQWPAVWDGTQYKLSKIVATDGAAPGAAFNSGPLDDDQSPLCTECCRDHHDTATSTPKFDAERSAGVDKYDLVAGLLVAQTNTSSGDYINACRLIRVDGFWRTASDAYSRHFALLPTKAKASAPTRPAGTGVPTTTAVTDYETFVKQYLGGVDGTSGAPPTNAGTLFAGYTSLAETSPAALALEVGSPADVRYLHARGLYIDHLESDARALIVKALANKSRYCPSATTDAECVLLYLPVSTVNLTELAEWLPRKDSLDTTIIQVDGDNDGVYVWDVGQPSRSATQRDTGAVGDTADNVASINPSNAGLTRMDPDSIDDVDPYDGANQSDLQQFSIGGTTTTDGYSFWVNVVGPPVANVSWTAAPCSIPAGALDKFKCPNLPSNAAQSVRITVAGYNYRGADLNNQSNACTTNGNPKVDIPRFYNFEIATSVEICAVTVVAGLPVVGSCSSVTPSRVAVVGTDGYKGEQTEIDVTVAENEMIRINTSSSLSQFTRTGCTSSPARPIYNMMDY